MPDLQTRIFIGVDADDATTQLSAAITDGSFPVLSLMESTPLMWITHRPVTDRFPAAYELHVTAWVKKEA
jgi:hypothetical protein